MDRDVYLLRRSRFAKCSGPACTAVVAVLVLTRVMVHAMQHGSPAQPALSIRVYASPAVRSALQRAPEVAMLPMQFHSVTPNCYLVYGEFDGQLIPHKARSFDMTRSAVYFLLGKSFSKCGPEKR